MDEIITQMLAENRSLTLIVPAYAKAREAQLRAIQAHEKGCRAGPNEAGAARTHQLDQRTPSRPRRAG